MTPTTLLLAAGAKLVLVATVSVPASGSDLNFALSDRACLAIAYHDAPNSLVAPATLSVPSDGAPGASILPVPSGLAQVIRAAS